MVPCTRHGDTTHSAELYYEIEINGHIVKSGSHTFTANQKGDSDRLYLGKFRYNSNQRPPTSEEKNAFAAYDETGVRDKWRRYLPPAKIPQGQDAAAGGG